MANTVLHGDCLELMNDIPTGSIDMILCDLPYGTTACKWDIIIAFDLLWAQYKRIIKDNGAIVLTASQPFTSVLITSNIKDFRYCWVWEKQKASNFMSMKYNPAKYHEDIAVFSKKTHLYKPILEKFKCVEVVDQVAIDMAIIAMETALSFNVDTDKKTVMKHPPKYK